MQNKMLYIITYRYHETHFYKRIEAIEQPKKYEKS